MSSTKATTEYEKNGDYVDELTTTPTGKNNPSRAHEWQAYRVLSVTPENRQVINDGSDTETVTIEVLSNLDLLSNDRETVLDVDDDATVRIDGAEQTVTLTGGSGSIEISTTKSAGSTIDVEATDLASYPAESDSATIKVISA